MGVGIKESYTEIFKILNILPLISQYIFSIPFFVVNNKNQFWVISEIHVTSRNNSNFYQPLSHLTTYQKGPFYMVIKAYDSLPPEIKHLSPNIQKNK
jgi:hypothetical protein